MPTKCPICSRETLEPLGHQLGCWLGYLMLLIKSRAMMNELMAMSGNGYSVKLESE